MVTGFVVFAHGSRLEPANQAVRVVASQLSGGGDHLVEAGFLELGQPDLAGAVRRLIDHGATRVVVIPYFLTLGRHVEQDLPRLIRGISVQHDGIPIEVTPPLDGHPGLLEILRERVREASV